MVAFLVLAFFVAVAGGENQKAVDAAGGIAAYNQLHGK